MLPEGWQELYLKDMISSLNAGVSVNSEDRQANALEAGVLKISAVTAGIFDPSQNKVIRDNELEKATMTPLADRIIISRSNTEAHVGASAYVERSYPNLYLSDKLWQLEPAKINFPSMRWLSYWLASDATRKLLSKLATGTSGSMKNISKEQLLSLAVVTPSLAEQHRIVDMLTTWDQAISATQKLLANSRKQRLALLAETLRSAPAINDIDNKSDNGGFPISVQAGIPNLGDVPHGWQRVRLGDNLREVRRPVALEPDMQYTLVTVKRSRGGVQKREVLSGAEIKTPTQFFLKDGDFLISKRQIVHGACGIVPPELDGAVVSNEYAILNSDGKIDLNFLRYLSETKYFQQTCFHSSIGVHVEKMIFKTERWLAWPFNIPPLNEQKRIVEILNLAMKEISILEAQLAVLKQEKSSLMFQLLTGKRRLPLLAADTRAAA